MEGAGTPQATTHPPFASGGTASVSPGPRSLPLASSSSYSASSSSSGRAEILLLGLGQSPQSAPSSVQARVPGRPPAPPQIPEGPAEPRKSARKDYFAEKQKKLFSQFHLEYTTQFPSPCEGLPAPNLWVTQASGCRRG
jgi:hypothetical protein